jgi:hypothetical protein
LRKTPAPRKSIPTEGRSQEADPTQTGTHATKWPLHAQWARPAGHIFKPENKVEKPVPFLDAQKVAFKNTTFTTHPTTNSPQFTIHKHHENSKYPNKNHTPPRSFFLHSKSKNQS